MRILLGALLLLSACGGSPSPRKEPPRKKEKPEVVLPGRSPGVARPTFPASEPRDPVLLPGDLLLIKVYRHADLELEIRIPQSGGIRYPLIGQVEAAGRTSTDLEEELRKRLAKDFLHDPHVTVTVKEFAKRKVYVLGGVQKPDSYPISPNERITLLQLVSAAGGFTDRAYKERVQIVRRRGKEREVILLSLVEVEKAVARGEARADLELWPDDLVVIPSGARVVYVLGAVKQPGWFEIPNDTRMTVSMAISRAGSFTKFASTGRIQVLRQTAEGKSTKLVVDLDEIVNGRLDLDIDLEPGDVVWVPERGLF